MTLSPNMTEKHLEAIFDALPKEMNEGELCALTLTLHSAFLETQVEIISALISMVYTYGASQGISNEAISHALRLSANLHDDQDDIKQTTH